MELSLFKSRRDRDGDRGRHSPHGMFDAALCLGVCDKIVPGLMIGALAFGHLPTVFAPAGPMPSGIPNKEKARIRKLFAEGKAGREELLESEAGGLSFGPGTCTFCSTANSNQMLMEVGDYTCRAAAFIPPNTPLRDALSGTRGEARGADHGTGQPTIGHSRALFDEAPWSTPSWACSPPAAACGHPASDRDCARAAGLILDWERFSTSYPKWCHCWRA